MCVVSFFAHKIDYAGYDDFKQKHAVTFEAVPAALISMFIPGGPEIPLSERDAAFLGDSRFYAEAKACFDVSGFSHEAFPNLLSCYLAEIPDFEIMLLFDSYWKALRTAWETPDWYEIALNMDGCAPASPVSALCSIVPEEEMYEREFGIESFESLPEELNQLLYDFYLGAGEGLWSDRDHASGNRAGGMLGAIMPDTEFGKVQVLYVGAGLSCRLLDYTGNVLGYFDMGKELPLSASALRRNSAQNAAVLDAVKQSNINLMEADAAAGTALTVIISHWHYDHVRVLGELAGEYLRNGTYAAFWGQLRLICPAMQRWRGWTLTDYNRIKSALTHASNQAGFQLIPNALADQTQTLPLGQEVVLYKGDTQFSSHLHHHGIAAVVRGHGTNNWTLLPGDCSYDTLRWAAGVLDRQGVGYEYLVATHHGGTYAYNPLRRPIVMPLPNGSAPSTVVFSANGVAYKHPDPAVVADYGSRNWQNNVVLHQLCLSQQIEWYELI